VNSFPRKNLGFARANSLQANSVLQLVMAGTFALGVGATSHLMHHPSGSPLASSAPVMAASAPKLSPVVIAAVPVVGPAVENALNSAAGRALSNAGQAVASVVQPVLNPKPEIVTRETELDTGSSFTDLLTDSGVAENDAVAANVALTKVFDTRELKGGQSVTLSFSRVGADETLSSLTFQPEVTKEVTVVRNADNSFTANLKLVPITRQHFAARGEIHSSLYEAGERAHVPHALMASFMNVYAHEVDFQRDIHPGDRFEILYDQPTAANGAPAGEGTIIYAALIVGGKVKPVYRVTFNDGTVDYFDERGLSVRHALLRTPVAAAHITSSFGMRVNPILGYSMMHKGVDFGAPVGSPIFAAGNGTIVEIGRKGAYGRYILIRHNSRLETAYAHMSRFSPALYPGAKVRQGEVIGYVGMTGRSTGPHLHFEVHDGGRPVNPLSVNLPTGRMLEGKLLAQFKKGQTKIKQEFTTLAAVANSPSVTPASATTVAYPQKQTETCGTKGGC